MKNSITKKFGRYVKVITALLCALLCLMLSGCAGAEEKPENTGAKYTGVSDFTGATVCSQTGTMFDRILDGSISGLNHKYYDDISGMILVRNSAKDIFYGFNPDNELKNEIRLTISQ